MLGASWSIMENMQQPCGFALLHQHTGTLVTDAIVSIPMDVRKSQHSTMKHDVYYLEITLFFLLRQAGVTYESPITFAILMN